MTQTDLQQKLDEIEVIYNDFRQKLEEIKRMNEMIMKREIERIEENKIEQVLRNIKN